MPKKAPELEQSLSRLTEIVSALEAHDMTLEHAMNLYEEGVVLIERVRNELESAEQRITELRRRADGDIAEEEIEF